MFKKIGNVPFSWGSKLMGKDSQSEFYRHVKLRYCPYLIQRTMCVCLFIWFFVHLFASQCLWRITFFGVFRVKTITAEISLIRLACLAERALPHSLQQAGQAAFHHGSAHHDKTLFYSKELLLALCGLLVIRGIFEASFSKKFCLNSAR